MRIVQVSRLLIGFVLALATARTTDAALITFDSRALFNTSAPGLPIETFEAGIIGGFNQTICTGPLSSGAGSTCFPAGGLLPGVVYSASPDPSMALLGAGFLGNTSKVLGPTSFSSTFDLTFASANAVGLDVFSGPVAGNVIISAFSPTNAPLGSLTLLAPSVAGTFFGLISDAGPIGRLNIASQAALAGELVDNVAFGNVSVPEPATVLLLGIGLGASAVRRRCKRA